jgi:ketosteroid isomerase-like protein
MGQPTLSEVRASIEQGNRAFMEAVDRGDPAAITALYTAEGQVLPPNAEAVTGHEAIQAFWQAIGNMGIKGAQLDTREVEGHGDTAIEVGAYTLFGEGRQALDQGKYIVIWKQEGGQWKLHRDIFNSNLAPQAG